MPPAMRKAIDVATAIGLTAGAFFIIVVANSFLMARGGYSHGFNLWYNFIVRPDILGTIVLTACITMAYVFWKQTGGRPRL
jgi:hypothetical protein